MHANWPIKYLPVISRWISQAAAHSKRRALTLCGRLCPPEPQIDLRYVQSNSTTLFMIISADKTMEEYLYLRAVGLNCQLLAEIFTETGHWQLQEKPRIGFYTNLLEYQKKHFAKLSQRQIGRVIFLIDPWMRESVNAKFPLNAYRKILRLQKRNTRMDSEFPYCEGKDTLTDSCSLW